MSVMRARGISVTRYHRKGPIFDHQGRGVSLQMDLTLVQRDEVVMAFFKREGNILKRERAIYMKLKRARRIWELVV